MAVDGRGHLQHCAQLPQLRAESYPPAQEDEPAGHLSGYRAVTLAMHRHPWSSDQVEQGHAIHVGNYRQVHEADTGCTVEEHYRPHGCEGVRRTLGVQIWTPEGPHLGQWLAICEQTIPASMPVVRDREHFHVHLPSANKWASGEI